MRRTYAIYFERILIFIKKFLDMKEKKCKICWWPRWHDNPLISSCKSCTYKKSAENKNQSSIYTLKRTPVKKIWKKRLERVSEKGSEMKMFIEIWQERPRICKVCWKPIKFFHTSNFAHILWKKDYPDLRYEKENIELVHGIFEIEDEKTWRTYQCHQKLDKETSWNKQEIYEKIMKKTWQIK